MNAPKIIFEDKEILVLDKPAGLVVNRCSTVEQPTVQDWLESYFGLQGAGIGGRAGIVHRLDKETSGILLVAKTTEAFEKLQGQFKQRQVEKRYLALVHGKIAPQKGVIRAPIVRSPFNRKKFGVFLGGREAETAYRISRYYEHTILGDFSLAELLPKTGRTHQIRVHLKYLGHPLVGDEFYAGRKTARADRRWCSRQFLHACFLAFNHPETRKKISFSSPLPWELKKSLRILSSAAT